MPIFAEYRPLYKIAQILLVLYLSSRGGKSTLIRLQLFNWVLKDNCRSEILINASESGDLNVSVWGLDPSLNSAIQFALAEHLVERYSNGIKITKHGKEYAEKIKNDEGFQDTVTFLSKVEKGITESMILQISESWG